MRYTYRNVKTGVEFQSNCECMGADLVRLAPENAIEQAVQSAEPDKKTPKKTTKRGTKK